MTIPLPEIPLPLDDHCRISDLDFLAQSKISRRPLPFAPACSAAGRFRGAKESGDKSPHSKEGGRNGKRS